MKIEMNTLPEKFKEEWPGELESFSWMDFVTAIPSPIMLITSYKKNGKPNACLQSWSTFVGDSGHFFAIIGSISRFGHLYQTLNETNQCVINLFSEEFYEKCSNTITHNQYEVDEITSAGLTVEDAICVNSPRVKECFLNLECEVVWMKEHFEDSKDVVACLKVVSIAMNEENLNERLVGRYGEDGYIYNIHSPRNPINGEVYNTVVGKIVPKKLY